MNQLRFFTVLAIAQLIWCATFVAVSFIDKSILAVLMATMCLAGACESFAVVCEIKDRRDKWTR